MITFNNFIKNMAAKKTLQVTRENTFIPITSCIFLSGESVQYSSSVPYYEPCSCTGNCDSISCDCALQHGCAYTSDGMLKDHYLVSDSSSPPIIECSRFCSCDKSCPNRISQVESINSIYVNEAGKKGFGVFARTPLLKGTYVCEYIGQLVKLKQYEEQLKTASVCYSIKVCEHVNQDTLTTCIDASCYGNISRFINHSCSPNLVVIPVRSDCIVPRVCLFAVRDIDDGEQLCFSYYGDDGSTHSVTLGETPCYCNSDNCKKFLPLQV